MTAFTLASASTHAFTASMQPEADAWIRGVAGSYFQGMADRISKNHRSWNMSRIRSSNTKPETLVRSALHKQGFRFRKNSKRLPGKPDVVLAKYRTVIFVHGCFWHRHQGCKLAYIPRSRVDFWKKKFSDNVWRDVRNMRALEELGWNVHVIWQCEIENKTLFSARIDRIIQELRKKL